VNPKKAGQWVAVAGGALAILVALLAALDILIHTSPLPWLAAAGIFLAIGAGQKIPPLIRIGGN